MVHVIVEGNVSAEVTSYALEASGQITKGDLADPNDRVLGGTSVLGSVTSEGQDDYNVTGEITSFQWSGPEPTLYVDGQVRSIPIDNATDTPTNGDDTTDGTDGSTPTNGDSGGFLSGMDGGLLKWALIGGLGVAAVSSMKD